MIWTRGFLVWIYVIDKAVLDDAGTYECSAVSQYGSAKNQIKINVMSGLPPGTVSFKVRDWCAF